MDIQKIIKVFIIGGIIAVIGDLLLYPYLKQAFNLNLGR